MIRRYLPNILLVCASIVVACAMGEIAVRALHLESGNFVTLDACTGFKSAPHASGWYVGRDYRSWVRMNSAGFHDTEHAPEKPANVYRILLLGDSFFEGLHVPLEETVARQLQAHFGADKPVEVISLGTSSFATGQELLMYECYGRAYKPDMVVLGFYNGNDLQDNYLAAGPYNPRFALSATGTPVLDESYAANIAARQAAYRTVFPGALYWIKEHSAFARFVYNKVQIIKAKKAQQAEGIDAGNPIFFKDEPKAWQDAWRLTLALVKSLGTTVAHDGARFVIADIAAPEQLTASTEPALERPAQRLGSLARLQGWGFLDLRPAFVEAEAAGTHTHFEHDAHWSADGHALAANVIFAYLKTVLP